MRSDPPDYASFPSQGAYRPTFSSIPIDSSLVNGDEDRFGPPRRAEFQNFPSSNRYRSASADTRNISWYREDTAGYSSPASYRQNYRELTPPYQSRQSYSEYRESPPLYRERKEFSNGTSNLRDYPPPLPIQHRDHVAGSLLRERSPASSSALLDLLQRYPSARSSVLSRSSVSDGSQFSNSGSDFPRSYDSISEFPSIHSSYASTSQTIRPDELLHNRLHSDFPDDNPYYEGSLSNSFTDNYGTSCSSDFTPSEESPRSLPRDRDTWSGDYGTNWRDNCYADEDPYSSTATLRQAPIDISVLDDIVPNMSRSTNEWRSSFERAQQHFKIRPYDTPDQPVFHGFTSNGSASLPRELGRSSSASSIGQGLLSDALNKLEQGSSGRTTPANREPGNLGVFWSNSLISARAGSPTPSPRIPNTVTMTASERLNMLKQETPDSPPGAPPTPRRTDSIASKQRPFIDSSTMHSSNSAPNFSALDRAVAEMTTRGGCGRFPTDEHAFSPPLRQHHHNTRQNGVHSPSPDSLSDASSYGVPNGLPHPKPKHNVVEQLAKASLNSRPNFPSTGSVTSRIVELEKRPGTPTLRLAGSRLSAPPREVEAAPLSPRSTVFRTKPVVHMELSGRHGENTRSPLLNGRRELEPTAHFSFSLPQAPSASVSPSSRGNVIVNGGGSKAAQSLLERLRQEDHGVSNGHGHSSPTQSKRSLEEMGTGVDGLANKRLSLASSSSSSPSSGLGSSSPASSEASSSPSSGYGPLSRLTRGIDASLIGESPSAVHQPPPGRGWLLPGHRASTKSVPRFYFPMGKPASAAENDAALRRATDHIRGLAGGMIMKSDMDEVMAALGLPKYWKTPFWNAINPNDAERINGREVAAFWRRMTTVAHDQAARFVYTLSHGQRSYLVREDFAPFILDIIHSHPGLEFYRGSEEFHPKFVDIVAARIFWDVNRSWSERITAAELRKSKILENIRELETTDDINRMTDFFSYEHFYVVYCKFWELDADHDMAINREDFARHDEHAILPTVIDRIFSGAVSLGGRGGRPRKTIGLPEFTAFLLADEDKSHPRAIEYWFRILDLDGDGKISLHEMETLYRETTAVMESMKVETLSFEDLACLLTDIVKPVAKTHFTLADIKRAGPLAGRFFNAFINWRKFFIQESSEGEKGTVKNGEEDISDWERYCIEQYETMMESEDGEGEGGIDDEYSVTLDD